MVATEIARLEEARAAYGLAKADYAAARESYHSADPVELLRIQDLAAVKKADPDDPAKMADLLDALEAPLREDQGKALREATIRLGEAESEFRDATEALL